MAYTRYARPVSRTSHTLLMAAALLLSAMRSSTLAEAKEPAPRGGRPDILQLTLWTENLQALREGWAKFSDTLPEPGKMGMTRLVAYEENERFVYVSGWARHWTRRVILLKPGVIVVDDFGIRPAGGPVEWRVYARGEVEVDGSLPDYHGPDEKLQSVTILPTKATVTTKAQPYGDYRDAHVLSVSPKSAPPGKPGRYLHVFYTADRDPPGIQATTPRTGGPAHLKIAQGHMTYTLVLPDKPDQPGTIAVSAGGKAVLPERLLPAGVMPHGPAGVKLLERWDKPYRGRRVAPWDVGKVATQLVKAVEDGTVRPGRALVLGCGTGTNAVYLAKRGFDVTALDVAPTSLTLAQAKAKAAGVSVRWLVADAANPPAMKPFDFLFDRGCYHHVRWIDAKGYANVVRRLTKPGGLFLLLSFRATSSRQGKPRVQAKQLHADFDAAFDFRWLREMKFDTRRGPEQGPPAWSVLLQRKKSPAGDGP